MKEDSKNTKARRVEESNEASGNTGGVMLAMMLATLVAIGSSLSFSNRQVEDRD